MPEYQSLAELRRALTTDDPDQRANAYGDVMTIGVQPSQVLADEVQEETLQSLRAADILPDEAQTGMSTPEYRRRVVELLERIAGQGDA